MNPDTTSAQPPHRPPERCQAQARGLPCPALSAPR